MNKKIILVPVALLVLLYFIFLFRGFAPGTTEQKLFPRYSSESIVKISLNGGETVWERENDDWQFPGSQLPVDKDTLSFFLSLPREMTKHIISSRSASEEWLSGSYDVVFTDEGGKSFTLTLFETPSWNIGEGEGLYVGYGEDIFNVEGFQPLSSGNARIEIDYYVLSRNLQKENISFITLSTPLEGDAADSYNYRVEKDERGEWLLTSSVDQALFPQKVSPGKMTLFINHLINLRGEELRSRREEDPGEIRFSLDIRDNLGERYIINVGEKSEEGNELYLVTGPETGFTYYLERESLEDIAPDAGSLLTP